MIALIKSLLTRLISADLLKRLIKFTFQLLILLLPTQLALHFWPDWAYVYGFKIDYFSPTIYLTDILAILLFVFWTIQGFLRRTSQKRPYDKYIYLSAITILVVFVGINIYLAKSPWVAIYKWAKVIEFLLIGLFVARAKDFDFGSWIAKPLSFSLIAVSILAFVQFSLQETVGGLFFLFGERSFTATTPGIATFTMFGRELLRPYSVFPHPNVMAGFLGVGFFLLLRNLSRKSKTPIYYILSLVVTSLALVLSVSRGAWIAFVLVGLSLIAAKFNVDIFKRLYLLIVVSIIAMSLLLPIVSDRLLFSLGHIETVNHRLHLAKEAGTLIAENPIVGVGIGNYILGLVESSDFPKVTWWLQPAHNIFLLTFSETGFVGFYTFVLLLLTVITKAILRKENILLAALLFVVLTGFLDHYWVTLQQTQILFAVLVGLMFRKKG
ncbi:O-antigen ligase family protein [Patescibacteria group bacterium]|nr:O-antigen ligase family protein [Patescibacteria group bacterium]MBU0776712.1 O-antigen ligase family protein [Patescibacteria group bacterium]MBU0846156.1 O-antigen ligase family protein [Patescibacteria group bacterium]MBU0922755.1 O-antigen ligase family protein [Patescibacteria group bacterium]MBU1066272.1 O-antigen ligase family protein [Patescibacteria group bacterium]